MSQKNLDWHGRIGRRLRLRDIHILLNVVNWGSMAKTASFLGISQPAVSEAIADMEEALQVRLLDRGPRGVSPTVYGHAIIKRGLAVFDELRQAVNDIEHLADPNIGEVRVGCPENLAAGFVPEVINRLSRQHPRIAVHVVHGETAAMEFQELRARTVDLMLGRRFRPITEDDVTDEILCDDRYFVVAGARSPWAKKRKLALADLMSERWIFLPGNNVPSTFYAEVFRSQGLEMPANSVSTFSLHIRLHLLATGRFLTILPASVLAFNAKPWSLQTLKIDLPRATRPLALFTLKNRTLTPAAALFMEHARAVAQSIRASTTRLSRGPSPR